MQEFLVRSRANIIENGEKPSEYFCSLESNNNTSNVINVIEKENCETITNQKEILKETGKYCENLYASKENSQNDLDLNVHMQYINIPKLNGDEALNLEGMLTLKEAGQALKKYEK